jgi:hypothetical protein
MLEDNQKLRLMSTAIMLQDTIAAFEIDLEYQTLIDLYGSSIKTLQDEVQALEDAIAKPQLAGDVTFQSQLDDNGDLLTSLNQTIYDMGSFIDQIKIGINGVTNEVSID